MRLSGRGKAKMFAQRAALVLGTEEAPTFEVRATKKSGDVIGATGKCGRLRLNPINSRPFRNHSSIRSANLHSEPGTVSQPGTAVLDGQLANAQIFRGGERSTITSNPAADCEEISMF